MRGCSRPRSASFRTVPSVRKTASTTPRKSVANMASPKMNAPAYERASIPGGWPTFWRSRNAKGFARQERCGRPRGVLEVGDRVVLPQPVEEQEAGCQQQADYEHLPPQRLPQSVSDDR